MRTLPVNQSSGPFMEACEPFRLRIIVTSFISDFPLAGQLRKYGIGTCLA
jgi:hypothetical protein